MTDYRESGSASHVSSPAVQRPRRGLFSENRQAELGHVMERVVVVAGGPGSILSLPWRHTDRHPLPRSRQKHPISVLQVAPSIGFFHPLPFGADKRMIVPPASGDAQ